MDCLVLNSASDIKNIWTFFYGSPLPSPPFLFPFSLSAALSVAKAKGILEDKEQLWGALALQATTFCLQVEPNLLMCLCATY